jgi:hypothetical protein
MAISHDINVELLSFSDSVQITTQMKVAKRERGRGLDQETTKQRKNKHVPLLFKDLQTDRHHHFAISILSLTLDVIDRL